MFMKTSLLSKFVAVTLFSLVTFISMNAQNPMCMIGDATRYGWDKDKSSPMTQDGVNPSKFYYNAYLNAGSFKFLLQNSDWIPSWNKGADKTTVVKRNTYNDPDNSFSITTAGNYSIILDTIALTLSVTTMTETTPIPFNTVFMVGNAAPNGWDIGTATELIKNPANPFEFTYTGALTTGELKFPVNRNWGLKQDFFMKVSENQMVLQNSPDSKWVISESGNYSITLNTNTLAIDIRKLNTWLGSTGNWSAGSNWSTGSAPTNSEVVDINNAEVAIDQDVTAYQINVHAGAKLTINQDKSLTVSKLKLLSGSTGTGTFVNNGTVTVTTAEVQQYLASSRNWYISSPISNGTVPSGLTYYGYDETGSNASYSAPATEYWVANSAGTTLVQGKGYIAQPGIATTIGFSGTLNDGNIDIDLTRSGATYTGFNLVGNPYPSYLKFSDVSVSNSNIQTTMWYRTKNISNTYMFATYNASGDILIAPNANTMVTGYIPPMQAFWVKATFASTLTFTNDMRYHIDVSGNVIKVKAAQANPILRLQVSNGVNSDEAVVYFNPNAINTIDKYDSEKMSNNNSSIPEIYTTPVVGTANLAINGMNSVNAVNELPLGFTTGETNNFTIKASEISNFDADTQIILKDNLLGTETDLTAGNSYSFASDATSTADRFTVVFKTSGVATDVNKTICNNNFVFANGNLQIGVYSKKAIGNVSVFNAVGQKVADRALNATSSYINVPEAGMYMVSISNNGVTNARKVMVK